MENGQVELDAMFTRVYGPLYKQNEEVFRKLFGNFQAYYKGGDISLTDTISKVSVLAHYYIKGGNIRQVSLLLYLVS